MAIADPAAVRSAARRLWPAALVFAACLADQPLVAAKLRVPLDHSTIQGAIDASSDGDTIAVAPGTYFELLNFHGKAVTVRALAGPRRTIIDGNGSGPVVTFMSGEPRESTLEGFTIRGGFSVFRGGGIWMAGFETRPTIRGNHIVDNETVGTGAGIQIGFGGPWIEGNFIARNRQTGTGPGGGGGGIAVSNGFDTVIVGNRIENNRTGALTSGAGIRIGNGVDPLIANNVIRRNHSEGDGGGLSIVRLARALVIQNLIVENSAERGGGLYLLGSDSRLINNTVAGNTANQGEVAFVDWTRGSAVLENNLLIAAGPGAALACGSHRAALPTMAYNDLFSFGGILVAGPCNSPVGTAGNLSVDPRFASPNGYRLGRRSPVVDAGSPDPLAALERDLAGRPRLVDGDRDGEAVIDIGAYELPGRKR